MNLYKVRTDKEGRIVAMWPRSFAIESLAKMKDASITDFFLVQAS